VLLGIVARRYGKTIGGLSQPIGCEFSMNDLIAPRKSIQIRRLRRSELPVSTVKLARYLIGKTLVHDTPGGRISGRIVETEAYPVGDAAGHAFTGRSVANNSLFLAHGTSYVRFTYGSWWLFNVASENDGIGAGVLIRALEPLEGVARMELNRGTSRLRDLTRGPGRLAEALGIDKAHDGLDLCSVKGKIWFGTATRPAGKIGVSLRIGITKDAHRRLRFFERGNPFISGPLRLNS
jgi:DNA-3-methyladenine glycosylase